MSPPSRSYWPRFAPAVAIFRVPLEPVRNRADVTFRLDQPAGL
jgi:hypothetical protein